MKIGILSDSHGKVETLEQAIHALTAHGADALVHCGDLGGTACLRALGLAGKPAYAVSGNTDKKVAQLEAVAAESGVEFHCEVIEVPLSNGRFLVATHGHDDQLVNELVAGQQFPYLCLGHSHRRRDERIGKTRIINPGALYRAVPHSAALLDTEKDVVEFFELAD